MYWWTPYFTFNFLTISYLAKKLTNAKIVFLCHNVAPHEARFIDRILTKIGLSQSNAYIVHAQKEKELLLDIFPKANVIKHVHPIYDIFKEKFKEKDISDLKLRKKILLFFGFIRKYKGLDFLIKAMPDLVKEFPDLDLLVVGEFWDDAKDQKELIEQSPVKNHIKVIEDYIPNEIVGNYFKACDICVLPYRSATNSGIVQTAFAFHKPCVVTRVGGLPEVVLDKKTGYVIEPKSTKEIIKVVTEYYKENKQKEFEQNVINDLDRFSWDKLVKVLENTLK
tara:strand:+ start:11 stop:850 length:840 start_codon:yes stop_codon:yes gene_type:complete